MVPAAARSDILWREAETLDLDGGPLLRRFGLGLGSGGWGILRTGGWEGEGSRGIFGIVLKTISRLGFVLPKKHKNKMSNKIKNSCRSQIGVGGGGQ
jgi:hypothetical protein